MRVNLNWGSGKDLRKARSMDLKSGRSQVNEELRRGLWLSNASKICKIVHFQLTKTQPNLG